MTTNITSYLPEEKGIFNTIRFIVLSFYRYFFIVLIIYRYCSLDTYILRLVYHISWAESRGDFEEAKDMKNDLELVDKVLQLFSSGILQY